MDPISWSFLIHLTEEVKRIAIFLVVKSDDKDRIMVPHESVQAFEQAWDSIQADEAISLHINDMPSL